jgi:GDP-mannose 6-dehydrogenase
MEISIFGLGYVGSVSAACLANRGYTIIGVDPNETKVSMINAGKALIIEPQLSELTQQAVASGHLRATTSAEEGILASQLSFICVGTPSKTDSSLDLQYVIKACEEIGQALKKKSSYHVFAVRSTMFPGSMQKVVIPTIEKYSGKKAGVDFSICFNPEFMKEGCAVDDFSNPAKNVVGATDVRAFNTITKINDAVTNMPTTCLDIEAAELIKYCDNVWHALKVGFANEIGKVCKTLNIDSHRVMEVFCQDTKLNLSSYYLKPGFAFGGSCLPKDLRAFLYETQQLNLELPIIKAVLPSNKLHIENALKMIMDKGSKKVGILGFSFKANTDDLRESPTLELIERLLGKGYELTLFDKNVSAALSHGANRDYILKQLSHISDLMVDSIDEVIARADTIVIGNNACEFEQVLDAMPDNMVIIDLVRIKKERPTKKQYNGICW